MLSSTNTLNDVKTKLVKGYDYYGYSSVSGFNDAITNYNSEAELFDMIPVIGQAYYDSIKAKNKVGLTLIETYLYWAEIYFTCFRFVSFYAQIDNQSSMGKSESIKIEGYERTVSGGENGMDILASRYLDEARKSLAMAGYGANTHQLKRGDSSLSPFGETLIGYPYLK